jgi:hypothetical protein
MYKIKLDETVKSRETPYFVIPYLIRNPVILICSGYRPSPV